MDLGSRWQVSRDSHARRHPARGSHQSGGSSNSILLPRWLNLQGSAAPAGLPNANKPESLPNLGAETSHKCSLSKYARYRSRGDEARKCEQDWPFWEETLVRSGI